jgi:hypothetical protein
MRRIFLGDFMHAALLYGALGGNLKESLREEKGSRMHMS